MHLPPLQFDREIPLFPLPNCVLFPGVVQPLHIFEPRYRAMMKAALDEPGDGEGQRAIAMALLKPGWEKHYYGSPEIHPMTCIGRILAHELLDDGKYNLLLQGVTRARVLSERRVEVQGMGGAVYRVALLEPAADDLGKMTPAHETLQRKVLKELFEKTPLKDLTVTPTLAALFEEGIPTSRLIDALAFSLVQDIEAKQCLLEMCDPGARGERLLQELVALAARLGGDAKRDKTWPPALGVN